MKIGMMNDPVNNLFEEIKFAGKYQFDFLDLTIEPPRCQVEDVDWDRVQTFIRQHRLGVIGHTNPILPWASPIISLKEAALTELEKQLALFHRLGAQYVNLHAHWYQPHSPPREIGERIIASLHRLLKITNKFGLRLMLENQASGFFNTPDRLQPIFSRCPQLLFHLDVGHAQVAGKGRSLTADFIRRFGKRLTHVHLSDNRGVTDDHLALGEGMIDWKMTVEALKKTRYDGTVTLEVWNRAKLNRSRCRWLELWENSGM